MKKARVLHLCENCNETYWPSASDALVPAAMCSQECESAFVEEFDFDTYRDLVTEPANA